VLAGTAYAQISSASIASPSQLFAGTDAARWLRLVDGHKFTGWSPQGYHTVAARDRVVLHGTVNKIASAHVPSVSDVRPLTPVAPRGRAVRAGGAQCQQAAPPGGAME